MRRNVTKIQAGLLRNERQEGGVHGGCRVREFLVLVEERHVGVVQELPFGTVADQGLGLFGQLIGYRHAFLISTAMAVPDVPIAWFYPLFMLAMPIAWLLYTATASYVHGGTR